MATRKQKSSGRGSTFYGVLIGLLLGLGAAAAVAYFVMSSPMPFVDKATREPPRTSVEQNSSVDPNRGLATAPQKPPQKDELAALIATLPVEPGKPAPPLPEPPVVAPVTPKVSTTPGATPKQSDDKHVYFLQVGAFRVLEDAEAVQARMVLMGLPVQIQRADVNGVLVNRVRVGPYSRLDDMNKVRARLSQEKIDSNVIRQ